MKRLANSIFVALLAASSSTAWCAGWGAILHGSAVEDFNDEDVRQFLAAVKQVLDGPAQSPPVEWRDAGSGAGGSLSVVGNPQVKGFGECRSVRGSVYSKKRKGAPMTWTACKDPTGHWALVRAG
jgi:surface antigen